ncbi:hypothetical protein HY933_03915 [Candidatus Falkowbacteria bacterium]|nr:hypothetical protein [Candidatus Falkowbacteria bacterium]
MRKQFLLLGLLLLAIPLLTACGISFNSDGSGKQTEASQGGIFKSLDQGANWETKNTVPTSTGTPASISNVNVKRIVMDPQDHQAVYLATVGTGLLFSYDGGNNWQVPRNQPDAMRTVEDVAIDPQHSCTLYAGAGNRIFKSVNCSRTWEEIYYGTRPTDVILSLAVDWYEPAIVYAGTSEGNMLQSADGGRSWTAVERPNNQIKKIMVDPYDSRIVYLVTDKNGIFKTTNKGGTWEQLNDQFKDYKGSTDYRDITFSVAERNTLYFASRYGLLKSANGGVSWSPITLITDQGSANILALAVDPTNGRALYYSTENTLYRSLNGGSDWIAQKLPTTRAATALAVDFTEPSVVYMGVTQLAK